MYISIYAVVRNVVVFASIFTKNRSHFSVLYYLDDQIK